MKEDNNEDLLLNPIIIKSYDEAVKFIKENKDMFDKSDSEYNKEFWEDFGLFVFMMQNGLTQDDVENTCTKSEMKDGKIHVDVGVQLK